MRVLVGLAIASVMLAGGCRQSDETVKAELRAQIVERCSVANAPRAAEDSAFDAGKFCTCVSDQMIGNRSVAELRKLLESKEVAAEQGRQIGEGCFRQQSSPEMTAAAVEPANAAAPAENRAAPADGRAAPAQSRAAPAERRAAPVTRAANGAGNRAAGEDARAARDEAGEEPAEATEDEAVEDSQ